MKSYKHLYQELCSEENLAQAFKKAAKGKSRKQDIIAFSVNLKESLHSLRMQLIMETYTPKPLTTFIIRDPKTRKIRKSDFKDRVVHHAICNIIEPIFERLFIHDSFANRKGKGTLAALQRFDAFKLKASKNNTRQCYVLKADIRHYFEEVSHDILLSILGRRIKDGALIGLIRKVLKNYPGDIGMPLGNLTSQFFANVYLNELDQFVKHTLHARYYLRYVDDFVILHPDKHVLEGYKAQISSFLKERLSLEMHPGKTKIIPFNKGVAFLGFRNFPHHKLPRKTNIRTMWHRLAQRNYDMICLFLEGWLAYAKRASIYTLHRKISSFVEALFPGQISLLQIDRLIKVVGNV